VPRLDLEIAALTQSGPPEQARQQVPAGDGELLLVEVARQVNDLHAVEQRARNGVELIGGADEQHLGQIEIDVQVVVVEVPFCSGSSTSSRADAGSPWKEAPILSISSSMITGFDDSVSLSACTSLPGMAPM
jgi:hypothetical protein